MPSPLPYLRKRRGHIFFEWNKCLWDISCLGGVFPRLNFPRHSAREIFRLSTGIFRKYPSQTWYICLITPNII
jgi:hypothetical protein